MRSPSAYAGSPPFSADARPQQRASRCRGDKTLPASRSCRPRHRRAPAPRVDVVADGGDSQDAAAIGEQPRALACVRRQNGWSTPGGLAAAVQPANFRTLGHSAGIAARRDNDGQRRLIGKLRRLLRQAPLCASRASAPSRSLSRRASTTSASGSPKRTLYSISLGPIGADHQSRE